MSSKKIPLFDLSRQHLALKKDFEQIFSKLLDQSAFTYGRETEDFQNLFAKMHDSKFALGIRSGTASLWVALKSLGLTSHDEVITTPATFSATVDAIILAGAKPVFADVDPKTGNLDPRSVEEKITKNTKAILVVHLYGVPADMFRLKKIANQHRLFLLEDASHAHGSELNGKKVGSFGHFGCFSLYPSKSLGSLGNAGVLTSNSAKLIKKAEQYAHHGIKDKSKKYLHSLVGMNELIDNIQAAFLLKKLEFFPEWIKKRRRIVEEYNHVFREFGHQGMFCYPTSKPNFYVFSVQMKNRKKFEKFMNDQQISTGIYYPTPVHLQPSMKFLGYKKGDFPVAEEFARQTISLPLFPELTEAEINRIKTAIREYFIGEK
ncbi:MAG: DegT/DnrJ/EryC1/StrS family aminotransferase [Patescibacteria group bacterium]